MSPPASGACRASLMTPDGPGAIAIFELIGDVVPVLAALTNRDDWTINEKRLSNLGGIDEGIVARIDETHALIMPHGGMRIIRLLAARLCELGVEIASSREIDPEHAFPEAENRSEALMLDALARAASPLAIDILLDLPRRFDDARECTKDDIERARRLNRLIDPPLVVLAGRPNVGKSTLTNALFGREISIDLDRPGTTRDYTGGLLDLGGLVVHWHDTAGIGSTDDPLSLQVSKATAGLMERADLVIAMTDHESDWPELPVEAGLRIANKCDLGPRAEAELLISARTGAGLADLVRILRELLVPTSDLESESPWRLEQA